MLNLKTILNKKVFTKLNGEVVVNLIIRSVSFLGIKTNSGTNYQVTDETSMRSDLISQYYYQDSSFCDLLLKYNGYSNPFAIDTNDIIKIPETAILSSFGKDGQALEIGKPRKRKQIPYFNQLLKRIRLELTF